MRGKKSAHKSKSSRGVYPSICAWTVQYLQTIYGLSTSTEFLIYTNALVILHHGWCYISLFLRHRDRFLDFICCHCKIQYILCTIKRLQFARHLLCCKSPPDLLRILCTSTRECEIPQCDENTCSPTCYHCLHSHLWSWSLVIFVPFSLTYLPYCRS